MNPSVSQLSLYDVANVKGVAADIGHINTKAQATVRVLAPPPPPPSLSLRACAHALCSPPAAAAAAVFRPAIEAQIAACAHTSSSLYPRHARIHTCTQQGFEGPDALADALKGCDLVIIPAGVPRKPGMTRDDLFKINAGIVKGLVEACGKHCPGALLNIISNPVNSTVPIAAEALRRMGVYDARKVLGVTTLDVVRAKTFYADKLGVDVAGVDVPVVGGHAGITILPLFSQATPGHSLSAEDVDALTKRTQDGGTEVVLAKAGKGSATLSMAYAAALFADACLRGLNGQVATECAYVESSVEPGVPFFASRVKLSTEGVETIHPVGSMTAYEKGALEAMKPELVASIEKGVAFARGE